MPFCPLYARSHTLLTPLMAPLCEIGLAHPYLEPVSYLGTRPDTDAALTRAHGPPLASPDTTLKR